MASEAPMWKKKNPASFLGSKIPLAKHVMSLEVASHVKKLSVEIKSLEDHQKKVLLYFEGDVNQSGDHPVLA